MPSPLVDAVRSRIREEGRPLTPVERTMLLATLHAQPVAGTGDPVDRLEHALVGLRRAMDHGQVDPVTALAIFDLAKAARGVLVDDSPPPPPVHVHRRATAGAGAGGGRWRADVDG